MAATAESRDLEEFLADLSDKLLLCRELGHNWRPHTATFDGVAYDRTLLCPRCRTRRIQVLDTHGHVVSNGYHYPEGYLVKGLGHLAGEDRDMVRLASLQRTAHPVAVKGAA